MNGRQSKNTRRTALVTGGNRGIGFGVALRLAREGWRLALCATREENDCREALDTLRENGGEVLYCRLDVSDLAAHGPVLERIVERFGAVHLLVNNAGVAPLERRDVLDMAPESYDRVLGINLRGPFFLTQAVARLMLKQRETSDEPRTIVNVSSISATVVSISRGEYCLSKAGVSMATQLWAARLAPHGIGVYEVRPGIIATDMTAAVREKYDALIAGGLIPQGRWGTPDDVGATVAMLARGDLPYSTGQVLMVDGGQTLPRL